MIFYIFESTDKFRSCFDLRSQESLLPADIPKKNIGKLLFNLRRSARHREAVE